ncbi:ATP-binding protein [Shewanella submarina]|uniref:histidine kinase n=1 Tax=Shewanella submarina TaxID=2016376 RepID=A0ABV7GL19_9GAMM|nr:ATP-binding protein [Shewanella submarina]MCL1036063.1 ATP-binding protein [Shewanella submarina]
MTLALRLTGVCVASSLLGTALGIWMWQWLGAGAILAALVIACMVAGLAARLLTRQLHTSLASLETGLLNFKDNDFSVRIPETGSGQLHNLSVLFNEAAARLRQERQYIYQRELLLDKVIHSSPNVMLLLDDNNRVIYSNDAARHLLNQGQMINGLMLSELEVRLPTEFHNALQSGTDGLFSVGDGEVQTWHLSRGRFQLNGQRHHLLLLKQMTRELSRQEVSVWKKIIRVIGHELNNSLAPISSMVNSGKLICRDYHEPKLDLIFNTIEDRTAHLSQFIFNYTRFAKMPLPSQETVEWSPFLAQLAAQYSFKLEGALPEYPGWFDRIQLEQVLLNLLKNAHESGSANDDICMLLESEHRESKSGVRISVSDRGSGMSADVLRQALLPFYSTKRSGSGIGLSLCREIVEAHDGQISLHNREGGGLSVNIWLPLANSSAAQQDKRHTQ